MTNIRNGLLLQHVTKIDGIPDEIDIIVSRIVVEHYLSLLQSRHDWLILSYSLEERIEILNE